MSVWVDEDMTEPVKEDPVREQLSACLDGELPAPEVDLLVKQVGRDSQRGAALGRYALIGEVLRGQQGTAIAPPGFASRVSAAIAAEPPLEADTFKQPTRVPNWLRPAAGMAIAASAAAAAILVLQPAPERLDGVQIAQSDVSQSVTQSAQAGADASNDAASYIVPAGATGSGAYVPAARLTNYVVAHSEYTMPLGRRSVLSGMLAEEEESVDELIDAARSLPTDSTPRQ